MIKVNNQIITIGHFPDNTQIIKFDRNKLFDSHVTIHWKYESDEECMTLYFLVKHLRNIPICGKDLKIHLRMWYLPNARMDRVKNYDEVFTLKYFAEFINSLNCDSVELLDVHSDVGRGMINNVIEVNSLVADYVGKAIDEIAEMGYESPILYFPDAGAKKRYDYLVSKFGEEGVLYGEKIREWITGKILGLKIVQDLPIVSDEKPILMIDDIISYGGTMKYSAEKLKEMGFKHIFIYCSHLENSVLNEEKGTLLPLLNNGTVEKLFTTDSLFSGNHEAITKL